MKSKVNKRPEFDIRNLESIEDVQAALETMEHDLQADRLDLLRNFNNTYLIVTRNVHNGIKTGRFDDPGFLTLFDKRFASYYFEALRTFLDGGLAPPAWMAAFQASEQRRATPFMCLVLGVNAHVNNDICQVLLDCQAGKRHYSDYVRVNTVIRDSFYEAVDSLGSSAGLLDPKKKSLKPLYKFAANYLIKYWRAKAWRRYRRLQAGNLTVTAVERSAYNTAQLLSRLPV